MRVSFATAFASKPRDEWVDQLAPADTCVAPVLSIAEVVEHPQFTARRRFVEAEHPTHGRFRQTAAVLAGQPEHMGPYELREYGTTDTHVLRDAGYTDDEIATLVEQGATVSLVVSTCTDAYAHAEKEGDWKMAREAFDLVQEIASSYARQADERMRAAVAREDTKAGRPKGKKRV